jgi:coenzyme PQQ synthesis protein D (PqqD)
MDADTSVALLPCIRLVETDMGGLVVDESTFVASEVNVSGLIILNKCTDGARLGEVVEAFAEEAQCAYDEADTAVRDFLGAAEAEGWISISGPARGA